jgi:hypothetical protein
LQRFLQTFARQAEPNADQNSAESAFELVHQTLAHVHKQMNSKGACVQQLLQLAVTRVAPMPVAPVTGGLFKDTPSSTSPASTASPAAVSPSSLFDNIPLPMASPHPSEDGAELYEEQHGGQDMPLTVQSQTRVSREELGEAMYAALLELAIGAVAPFLIDFAERQEAAKDRTLHEGLARDPEHVALRAQLQLEDEEGLKEADWTKAVEELKLMNACGSFVGKLAALFHCKEAIFRELARNQVGECVGGVCWGSVLGVCWGSVLGECVGGVCWEYAPFLATLAHHRSCTHLHLLPLPLLPPP